MTDSKAEVYSSNKALLAQHGSGSFYGRHKNPRSEINTSPPLTQSRVDSEEMVASKVQSRRLDPAPRLPRKLNPNQETDVNIWSSPEYPMDRRDGITAKITQTAAPKVER